MNIKELIETINNEALTFGTAAINDHDMLDIKAELERLWRIEECAAECVKLRNTSPDKWNSVGALYMANDKLEKALEAKGQ